jgi:hypothetical protein
MVIYYQIGTVITIIGGLSLLIRHTLKNGGKRYE